MPEKKLEGYFIIYEDGSVKFTVKTYEGERPKSISFDAGTSLAEDVCEYLLEEH